MVGTTVASLENFTMAPRQRSRSTRSSKAAELLQLSLSQSAPPSRNRCRSRLAISELYIPTSKGVVFQDKEFQREIVAKAERLIEIAQSPESSECNARIAKKALKYRQMRSRQLNGAVRSSALAFSNAKVPVAV